MEQEKYIENLIERFLDGATTLSEEQELYAYFSGNNVPEHLNKYKELFVWFDSGMAQEITETPVEILTELRPKRTFRLWGTVASIAAAITLFVLIYPHIAEPEFDPFEGSYIVRDGVKITDRALIQAELESTLLLVETQENEVNKMLLESHSEELKDQYGKYCHDKELLKIIQSFPEGEARNEILKTLSNNE